MIAFLCLVLLSPAVLSVHLEQDDVLITEMKTAFSEAIESHLLSEYIVLHPILSKMNQTWLQCRNAMLPECVLCMTSNCETEYRIDWHEWKEFGYELFGSDLDELIKKMEQDESEDPFDVEDVDKRKSSTLSGAIKVAKVGYKVGSYVADNWDSISSTSSDAVDSVTSFFSGWGRKRRSYRYGGYPYKKAYPYKRTSPFGPQPPLTLATQKRDYGMIGNNVFAECTQQCPECEIFSEGCGEKMMSNKAMLARMMNKMIQLYRANDSPQSLLSKVEYEPTNYDLSSSSFGEVYVTIRRPSGEERYLSRYRLRFDLPQISALEMAEEFMSRWCQ